MKKLITSAVILSSLIISSLFASSAFAASDYYLQIKGTKGESSTQVVKCPDGACAVSNLPADTYAVSVVDATGKSLPLDNVKYECVVSPRDSASGLATGKRMHKPMVITKEMSSSPLVTTDAQSNLNITCVSSPSDAPVAPAAAAVKASGYDLKEAKK